MKMKDFSFGRTLDDQPVFGFEISNSNAVSMKVINYGATLISLKVPDKAGLSEEVALGLKTIRAYETHGLYFGSTIGRVANRIQDGLFNLDGVEYKLAKNEQGRSHLHGGEKGFDKVVWRMRADTKADGISLFCEYESRDGEEGYPGNLQVTVRYTLNEQNQVIIDYTAETDRICPVNLTNHTYWNLGGCYRESILNHELTLNCDLYLPVDNQSLPTGALEPVTGTPWDFRKPKRIGQEIEAAGGYDHCFVSAMQKRACLPVAALFDPVSQREMKISTTEPGIQFYSGNFLDKMHDQGFRKHDGLCLETQLFPDALNHAAFPSNLLEPGDIYTHKTVHAFTVRRKS